MKLGNINIAKAFLGTIEIKKISFGTTKVWENREFSPIIVYGVYDFINGVNKINTLNLETLTIGTPIDSPSNITYRNIISAGDKYFFIYNSSLIYMYNIKTLELILSFTNPSSDSISYILVENNIAYILYAYSGYNMCKVNILTSELIASTSTNSLISTGPLIFTDNSDYLFLGGASNTDKPRKIDKRTLSITTGSTNFKGGSSRVSILTYPDKEYIYTLYYGNLYKLKLSDLTVTSEYNYSKYGNLLYMMFPFEDDSTWFGYASTNLQVFLRTDDSKLTTQVYPLTGYNSNSNFLYADADYIYAYGYDGQNSHFFGKFSRTDQTLVDSVVLNGHPMFNYINNYERYLGG